MTYSYDRRTAAYYRPKAGTPISEILARWVDAGDKVYDDAMPIFYSPRELWPHREYTWTRENSRSGYAKVRGKSVLLDGPLKWDALAEDLRLRGWDTDDSLKLMLGKNGQSKVGEGNHRLAIAREIGLRRVPVFIFFGQKVRKDPSAPMSVEIAPKALEKAVKKQITKRPKQRDTSQEEIDELMGLLGLSASWKAKP